MFLFRLTFTAFILAMCSGTVSATEIRGRLIDKLSKQPIAGASLLATADGLEYQASTDEQGSLPSQPLRPAAVLHASPSDLGRL